MDFNLTDDQELIVQSYADLMESEDWNFYFLECDEKHEYPLRWVKALCDLGFDRLLIPEEYGGIPVEQPYVTLMAIYEVLRRGRSAALLSPSRAPAPTSPASPPLTSAATARSTSTAPRPSSPRPRA